MPEGWGDFLVAEVGASAALGGLLFVGLSLNLDRILSFPGLPNRAFTALVLLIMGLVLCSIMLIPGQSRTAIAIEVLAIAGVLWGWRVRADIREFRKKEFYSLAVFAGVLVLFQIAVLPYLIGGVLILALPDSEAGFYLVAASVVLTFVKAMLDAWVLLVEIKR